MGQHEAHYIRLLQVKLGERREKDEKGTSQQLTQINIIASVYQLINCFICIFTCTFFISWPITWGSETVVRLEQPPSNGKSW